MSTKKQLKKAYKAGQQIGYATRKINRDIEQDQLMSSRKVTGRIKEWMKNRV